VRLQGAAASVAADEARLLPASAGFRRVPADETATILQMARDHAAAHPLVVRVSALPGHLGDVLELVASALPRCDVAADVLGGRVRCGVAGAEAMDAQALTTLRVRVESLGGSLTLERAPAGLLDRIPAYGDGGRAGSLGLALRGRFDPGGVLSPGRFVR
jgi:hypothetical protein